MQLDGRLIKKDGHDYLMEALNLPDYSTYEILRDKLRYVIHNCNSIDADFVRTSARNGNGINETIIKLIKKYINGNKIKKKNYTTL